MSNGLRPPSTVAGWAIWAVVTIGIIAAVYVAATAMGITIPGWIITLLWIVLAVVIVVGVIRFIASMGGSPPP